MFNAEFIIMPPKEKSAALAVAAIRLPPDRSRMRGRAERTQHETVTVIAAGELEVVILYHPKSARVAAQCASYS